MADDFAATTPANLLAAPVAGFAALVVAVILDEKCAVYRVKAAAGQLDPRLLAELERARDAVHQAADAWRIHRAEQARREAETVVGAITSADATTSVDLTDVAAESPHEVDTGTAALALGVTASWVRRLLKAGLLDGRQVGRAWLIRTSTLRELEGLRNGRVRTAA